MPIVDQKKRPKNSFDWVGIVVFLVIVFGSQFAAQLSQLIFLATGVRVGSTVLLPIIIVFAVVFPMIVSGLRSLGRSAEGGSSFPPMSQPPMAPPTRVPPANPMAIPPPTAPQPLLRPPAPTSNSASLGDMSRQYMPKPPAFEPVINPMVVAWLIGGVVLFGAILFFIALTAGMLP